MAKSWVPGPEIEPKTLRPENSQSLDQGFLPSIAVHFMRGIVKVLSPNVPHRPVPLGGLQQRSKRACSSITLGSP